MQQRNNDFNKTKQPQDFWKKQHIIHKLDGWCRVSQYYSPWNYPKWTDRGGIY